MSLPTLLYILDADGTIRGCNVEGQPCPNAPGEQYLLPGAAEAIRAIEAAGHVWAIASNQGGVELGYTTPDLVNATFSELKDMLELEGCSQPPNALVFWCGSMDPADPDRKPNAGMLEKAMLAHGIPPVRTIMVGDQDSDNEAAVQAGCGFMHADTWRGA